MYGVQNQTLPVNEKQKAKTTKEDDEETTIDEVIEELKNIINDAETEQYLKEQKQKNEDAQKPTKIVMRVENVCETVLEKETEIIPSNLHPQPPRRTRSLVHLFIPTEDYDYSNKEIFFENETTFTSEEGSDSLLSASKYHLPRLEKSLKGCKKDNLKRSESFRHDDQPTPLSPGFQEQKRDTMQELAAHRLKSKSLDRIDNGLDAIVDIVMTDKKEDDDTSLIPKNHPAKLLTRSISNVFGGKVMKRSAAIEEKQKIFLPQQTFNLTERLEPPYLFPRLQEKRGNPGCLVKRGHGNAGLYSGYAAKEEKNFKKKSDYVMALNKKNSLEKVTDLPSGLY